MTTPCRTDYRETGRDWVREPPDITRVETMEMVKLCHTCPVRWKCYAAAVGMKKDAVGVWGAFYWKNGTPIDPLGRVGAKKSMYPGVSWDQNHGMWKAYGRAEERNHHLGYFPYWDEDRAGAAVQKWIAEREKKGA